MVDTAITTSNLAPGRDPKAEVALGNRSKIEEDSGHASDASAVSTASSRHQRKKYKHVFAVHSSQKISCLSSDATDTPSFAGFRNLLVLVLGM